VFGALFSGRARCDRGNGVSRRLPAADTEPQQVLPRLRKEPCMPNRIPATPAELKSIGLKATLPRLRILDIFQRAAATGGARHLSAEDVYRVLLAEHLDVGLATVYRVLTQFEQAGLLVRHHLSRSFMINF